MRIITLNTWGGKLYEPLIEFIKKHAEDTDVFCFQDVLFGSEEGFSPIEKGRLNLFSEIKKILPNHESFISREMNHSQIVSEILPPDVGAGKVLFYKKSFKLLDRGEFAVTDKDVSDSLMACKCQWVKLQDNDKETTILNLHGLWQKDSKKLDTPERIEQSKRIAGFLATVSSRKVFCGDFNMVPHGESMALLEEGMVNLIKEHGVTSTRSSHYPKEERFADYILVSKDIKVQGFEVLPDEVSDHLAVCVDFE